MLRPNLSLAAPIVALSVLATLAVPAAAQGRMLVSVPGPATYLGEYDLASHSLHAPGGADGGVIVYDNTAFLGAAAIIGAPAGAVVMDWGTLSALGHNQISDIQIGYITGAPGPVDLRVRVHAGATGSGDLGTIAVELDVTGLPGSATGAFEAYVLDIDLAGIGADAYVADGPVGYSIGAETPDTGPLLAGPPNPAGVVDLVDIYDSEAVYLATTDLGEANASVYFQMTGQEPPECFLVLGEGLGPGSATFTGAGHEFTTQVGDVAQSFPVLLDDIPEFVIWDPPAPVRSATLGLSSAGLAGVDLSAAEPWAFSAQVVMWNPGVFPANPEQSSHGLAVVVMPDGRVFSQPYGVSDGGLAIWAETDWNAAGQKVLRLPFSIPGF